jgi:plastocyanin
MPHPSFRSPLAKALLTISLFAVAAAGRAATVTVTVSNFEFDPQTVTVDPGDKVTWNNVDGFHSVTADDSGFGFGFDTASAPWTYSHTFTTPGTYGYYCNIHGGVGSGMFGTVVVRSGSANHPGTLRLSLASYSVAEGAGSASIAVQRLDGSDGAVSIHYGASSGSAVAGQDFTAVSGTLTWGDGDSASKSFQVPITADSTDETDETVVLALNNPGGGATLDPAHRTATLTIVDDDNGPPTGTPPAAPTGLLAVGQSTTEVALSWVDHASNETGFHIEQRTVGGSFQEVATTAANATTAVVGGLQPSTFYLFRVRAAGGGGFSGYSNEAEGATLGAVAPCVAGPETLCINNSRFRVTVDWRIPDGSTGPGHAAPVPSAPDSGLFYFFAPANLEMLVKVLNACVDPFNHYWVFYSATTNVEFAVVVTDTANGKTRAYFNPLNRSAPPVQDVSAFATCP